MDYILPIEIWQIILDKVKIKSQLKLTTACKYFHNNLKVTDFSNVKYKYASLLTDDILKNYPYITKLKISNNVKINNLNHFKKLEELYFYGNCDLDNESLKGLNLKKLVLFDNPNLTDINHLTNLKELIIIDSKCGIGNDGIKNLNVKYLNVTNNSNITKINHMTNLTMLVAPGNDCGIDNDSIKGLNLSHLGAEGNYKISEIEHLTELEYLNAGWNGSINDNSIKKLNLKKLIACCNPRITEEGYKHMTNLEYVKLDSVFGKW